MKTFEEALETVIPRGADHAAAVAQFVADAMKANDIHAEAERNPKLTRLLMAAHFSACCQPHGMLNAFMLGLRVGMEMERSETGGIAFDAVAPGGGKAG